MPKLSNKIIRRTHSPTPSDRFITAKTRPPTSKASANDVAAPAAAPPGASHGADADADGQGVVNGVLIAADRSHWELLVVPLLWCAISGATLWAMQSPDALLAPAAALLALVLACWKTFSRLRHARIGGKPAHRRAQRNGPQGGG